MGRIELRNKPICITGASSGIGRATAIECAKAGMPVVCAARRLEKLEAVVSEIRAAGGRAEAVRCDVVEKESCRRAVETTIEKFGSIYAIFANAGYGVEAPIHRMSDEELRAIFETNVWGTINTIRPALEPMIEAGRGHVLMCSSCVAKLSLPFYGAYCATKAAQLHFGAAMRLELAPLGLRVSTVHPVGTKTEFFETVKQVSRRSSLIDHAPQKLLQPPGRVARAVVRCLRRPRAEVWTSRLVRYGVSIASATPWLTDAVIGRMSGRRLRESRMSASEYEADTPQPRVANDVQD